MPSTQLDSSGSEAPVIILALVEVEDAPLKGLASATVASQRAALEFSIVEVDDAPRKGLVSATTASQRAALEVRAPRGGLSSATTTSQWAALREADVCDDENPVVEEDKDCDQNAPLGDIVKSCAEAKSCVVHGVDEEEADA